jgi:hypothetical protein
VGGGGGGGGCASADGSGGGERIGEARAELPFCSMAAAAGSSEMCPSVWAGVLSRDSGSVATGCSNKSNATAG